MMPLSQQAKKGITVVGLVTNPDYQGKIVLFLHYRHKKDYVWNTGDSLSVILVLPCPKIKVN